MQERKCVGQFQSPHADQITAFAASPTLAWVGAVDGAISCWDLAAVLRGGRSFGQVQAKAVWRSHSNTIRAMVYVEEGRLWSASGDRTVKIWDARVREMLHAVLLQQRDDGGRWWSWCADGNGAAGSEGSHRTGTHRSRTVISTSLTLLWRCSRTGHELAACGLGDVVRLGGSAPALLRRRQWAVPDGFRGAQRLGAGAGAVVAVCLERIQRSHHSGMGPACTRVPCGALWHSVDAMREE
jgi:hypothetical protein